MVQQQKRRFTLGGGLRGSIINKSGTVASSSGAAGGDGIPANSPSYEELTGDQIHSSSSPPELPVSVGSSPFSQQQQTWDMTTIAGGGAGATTTTPSMKKKNHRIKSNVNKAQKVATSAGTFRLNRILHQPSEYRVSHVPEYHDNDDYNTNDHNHDYLNQQQYQPNRDALRKETLKDPTNPIQVGTYVAKVVTPPLKVVGGGGVDSRSSTSFSSSSMMIGKKGSSSLYSNNKMITTTTNAHPSSSSSSSLVVTTQECLLCMACQNFEMTGERIATHVLADPTGYGKHKRSLGYLTTTTTPSAAGAAGTGVVKNNRIHNNNKLKYLCIVRATNQPLMKEQKSKKKSNPTTTKTSTGTTTTTTTTTTTNLNQTTTETNNPVSESTQMEEDAYDVMFGDNPDDDDDDEEEENDDDDAQGNEKHHHYNNINNNTPLDEFNKKYPEISSFPVLVCVVLNPDGTGPEIKKLAPLDQLTTITILSTGSILQLTFSGGDSVVIDFATTTTTTTTTMEEDTGPAGLSKERFVWSLLQIHAMLCLSVVERNLIEPTTTTTSSSTTTTTKVLPPLNVRNLDRAELQYIATVNGFLRASPTLCALLDRQRNVMDDDQYPDGGGGGAGGNEMDGMAYDLMMGNYNTRVALFHSVEERADAEEILNGDQFRNEEQIEQVSLLLQRRMHDLEAETCRRLIAWEDEKHYNLIGQSGMFANQAKRDTVDALSLASLFTTLNALDLELKQMEDWLEDRRAVIQPLTDDCRDIEEENRQLEQQWKSYDMLGTELNRLLKGVDVARESERILRNPASALVYDEAGNINVKDSERGVDKIYEAGQALKGAMDNAITAGGVHLRAVSERVEGLTAMSNQFCTALAQIVVTVMEELKTQVVAGSDGGKVSKADTHAMIAKKIRDTQRQFQSSLLAYMNLIEILALLRPQLLPAIRDAYSEMVSEGILMKKRMKGYFQALPGKNAAYTQFVARDLKDYSPNDEEKKTVNATDMAAALGELLPVVAREAYFTAALFGLSKTTLNGREKKRNFESAKRSVDHSTQYFRYYIQRTCGIILENQVDPSHPQAARLMRGDPMLSLVASIYLNEAMEQYIDTEKKGGDHSLSLAYVRATILALRKKVDKQWVAWVEEQIEWIRSNPGVPVNGKKAGVFLSFRNFPPYLDHVVTCCRDGKPEGYTPDLANIQVVSYYLQKMSNAMLDSLRVCSERETTDQVYAANVMRMENTYFFTQQIKALGPEVSTLFQKQLTKASAVCKQSTDAYLGWMIKREFKALHTLFAQISRVRRDVGDKDVPIHVPRSTFVKTLQKESSREVLKEKIVTLYTRMEKHLSEDGGLLPIAWKALVKVLYEWFGRWQKLSSSCYDHVMEPSAVDVVRIAKQTVEPSTGTGTATKASTPATGTKAKPATRPPSSRTPAAPRTTPTKSSASRIKEMIA